MGRMSGVIGKLLSFTRVTRENAKLSDVKVNVGGSDVITAEYSHPSGDDSHPLPNDYVTLVRIPRSGRVLVVGFTETDAEQKAAAGDKRIYSRDSSRAETAEVWLKSDGTIDMNNSNGSFVLSPDGSMKGTSPDGNFELRADGSHRTENGSGYLELREDGVVEINGATIGTDGAIVSPVSVTAPVVTGSTSVVANGKELAGHDHAILGGSSAPGPTGTNN